MSLTTVNAYDMLYTIVADYIQYTCIDIVATRCLEIDGDRHMKLELIHGIATILHNVIAESTLTLLVLLVLVGNWLVSTMYCGLIEVKTLLSVEHLCLSVEFIYHIGKITLVK